MSETVQKILTTKLLDRLSSEFGSAFYLLESKSFENNYKELADSFKKYYSKIRA